MNVPAATPDSRPLAPLGSPRRRMHPDMPWLLSVWSIGIVALFIWNARFAYSQASFWGAVVSAVSGAMALVIRARGGGGRERVAWWITVLSFLSSMLLTVVLLIFGAGSVPPAKYPRVLQRVASLSGADTESILAARGSAFSHATVWRLRFLSPVSADLFATEGLQEVAAATIPGSFGSAFPLAWRPPRRPTCRYFATPCSPLADWMPEGEHLLAMFDPVVGELYAIEVMVF